MSGNVKQFVDFTGNTNNDTGANNTTSIQPITNGEVVDATVSGRPGESLRQRTEAIRNVMADTLYLRDSDRGFIVFCTGNVTWPGSTTNTQNGIPVITNTLWLVPMLTPGTVQIGAPPVASSFGVAHLKRSSDSANAILVTSQRRSYAAGDQINITVTSGGSFSCSLDVENGLRRTIKIIATGSTTLGTVITALNGIIPPAPDNTQLVTAALEGGASSGDFLLVPQARQYVTGNFDGEAHQISVSTLSSFFSSNPTQALAEGDSLCIRFDMVTDLSSTGGRRQAIPENSNTSVPSGSLFNSRVHPEFLTNAIPVCKVLNGALVFPGGSTILAGSVGASLAGNLASDIRFAGSATWADGTTNPSTSVEAQLDKIVSDLAGATGSGKIQGSAVGVDLPASTLAAQLSSLVTGWLKLDRVNTISASQVFSASQAFNAPVTVTGTLDVSGKVTQIPQIKLLQHRSPGSIGGDIGVLVPAGTSVPNGHYVQIEIDINRTITGISARVVDDGGSSFLICGLAIHSPGTTGSPPSDTPTDISGTLSTNSAGTGFLSTVSKTGISVPIIADRTYYMFIREAGVSTGGQRVYRMEYTWV